MSFNRDPIPGVIETMRTRNSLDLSKKDVYFLINYQQRNGAKLTEEGRRIKVGQSHDTVSVCVCN